MIIKRKWSTEETKNQSKRFPKKFMAEVVQILTKAKELGVGITPLAKTDNVADCIIDELLLFTPNRNSTFILLPNGDKSSYETKDEESDAVIIAILTLALKHGVITSLTSDTDFVSAMTLELLKTLE